jgi:cystathionine beta-lyase/cystathionine gamma-synthase
VTSLAVAVNPPRTAEKRGTSVLVRFNVGLEEPADLIADLEAALGKLS